MKYMKNVTHGIIIKIHQNIITFIFYEYLHMYEYEYILKLYKTSGRGNISVNIKTTKLLKYHAKGQLSCALRLDISTNRLIYFPRIENGTQ